MAAWNSTIRCSTSRKPNGTRTQLFEVAAGNSNGNPNLDPWRSTNYGASIEYYINPVSMVSAELFRINVQSFIENGNVQNCGLPDEDGVVRHHCITIVEPVQGSGNSIQGAEFDYRQGFTFLPGLLRYTGMEFNVTYAPSKTGQTDLAGHSIPFQDNSTESGNFILWFQSKSLPGPRGIQLPLEARGGESGGQHRRPGRCTRRRRSTSTRRSRTRSTSTPRSILNGENLTNEYQRYYLVWPSQEGHANFSERMFTVGLRGQW